MIRGMWGRTGIVVLGALVLVTGAGGASASQLRREDVA
jgi:hypothetical protein